MDNFLTLFTTELQYQDPTNPLESYELAAQLAQFSTVAELTDINTNIQSQESYLSSINNALMLDLIGKDVVATTDSIQVESGEAHPASFTIGTDASSVTVKIYDSSGDLVRSLDLGEQTSGSHSIGWDGLDSSGQTVDDGTYTLTVEAEDADGESIDASTSVTGTVYAVQLDSSSTNIILNSADGPSVTIDSVTQVQKTDETEE
jgi:flagellar basal-body rod modification protein FlgD